MAGETELVRGMRVLTADGKELGTVDQLLHDHFKVAAPPKRDFWLRRVFIRELAPERVTLCILAKDLDCHHEVDLGVEDAGDSPTEPASAAVAPRFEPAHLVYDLAHLQ